MKLISLSSGSKGNCAIVATNSTTIIIDIGIGIRKLTQGLRLISSDTSLDNLNILITHTHHDHISGLSSFSKKHSPNVYCTLENYLDVSTMIKRGKVILFEKDFYIGDITVSPFCVCHDTPCVGYSFYHQGQKISLLTDCGQLTDDILYAITDSNLIFIESNHDEDILKNNPNYPLVLKRRILSNRGHLSNLACAEGIKKIVNARLKHIILAHLSQENNYPTLAIKTIKSALDQCNFSDISVDYAPQGLFSKIYTIDNQNENQNQNESLEQISIEQLEIISNNKHKTSVKSVKQQA